MLLFENCEFCYNSDDKMGRPFVIIIKDREHSNGNDERWNIVTLGKDETKLVYEMLKKYFGENESD
jgi:hypothetical protein